MTKREKGKIKVGSFYKKMKEQGVRVRHSQRKREMRKKERKPVAKRCYIDSGTLAPLYIGYP